MPRIEDYPKTENGTPAKSINYYYEENRYTAIHAEFDVEFSICGHEFNSLKRQFEENVMEDARASLDG